MSDCCNVKKIFDHLTLQGYILDRQGDLTRAKRGNTTVWVSIRRKKEASYWRVGRRYEFGLPAEDFTRYIRMGKPVILFVVETSTDRIYAAPIRRLSTATRIYGGGKLDQGGTAFLPLSEFREVLKLK